MHKGYEYSRSQNPTRMAYERCVADLESGTAAFAFASGLAGTATVLDLFDSGAHVLCMDDLYGGTYRLFERVRKRSAGLSFGFVDFSDLAKVEAAIRPETRLFWIEIADQSAAEAGRSRGRRRAGEAARDHRRRRQHLRQPVGAAAARAWLRHGHALRHQISQRPFRHRRRHRRRRRPAGPAGAHDVPAERRRRRGRAVRQLPGAARPEDAGAAHGAPLPQRRRRRSLVGEASEGGARALPRTPEPSATRAGAAADARLRRHGDGHPQGYARRRAPLPRTLPDLRAGRELSAASRA